MGTTNLTTSPVDLHVHSSHSDGDWQVAEVVDAAAEQGVEVMALVDHNTMRGTEEFASAAEKNGIRTISACEISTTWRGETWHLLAYHVGEDARFSERIEAISSGQRAMYAKWLDLFEEAGVEIDRGAVEGFLEKSYLPFFGRFLDVVLPDLVRHPGHSRFAGAEYRDVVTALFRPGKPFYVADPPFPAIEEAIGWVHDAGGVAVVAHPGRSLPPAEAVEVLRPLAEAGLHGVEAWSTWHDRGTADAYAGVARDLGLIATQGSDFHGGVKAWAPAPGAMPGHAPDPFAVVDRITAAARR
ncbi:PHP domain-containing protein [Lentzea sp.]|uniref:PHP domain-containing protein n=1 Tax=Lentzea sp. TaxID=56099 RepID=UPI002D107ECA|nr:PHP domain-containing protein [Lentzea sp.]HUQ56478.1 PHP domain-containing protein [Lentzea sp.]